MAFISTISACLNGCTGITINDTTGFFNSTTNPYAWNDNTTLWKTDADGNEPYVTAATISISLNGGTATTVSVLDKIQASIFPEFELYQYTPVDSGGNFNLADGYYTITYTITDSNETVYTTDIVFVVYCNVACCVANKAAAVAAELCNDCDSQAYEDFLLADGILQALKATAESLGTAEFTKLLNKLQKLCGTSTTGGCGCGCS